MAGTDRKSRTRPGASASAASTDGESTSSLIERARAGDAEALERVFARQRQPLQRWASGRLPKWARDISDTEDLVQETLLQTFKRIGDFEPRRVGALQAYLRQAVLNRIRRWNRRVQIWERNQQIPLFGHAPRLLPDGGDGLGRRRDFNRGQIDSIAESLGSTSSRVTK
jgi:DNA-directed RNA polymerase specialized sigma24 family protein